MKTDAERNLAAEVRAVEEGHRAIATDVGTYRVVSDTRPGKAYVVRVGGWLHCDAVFDCTPHGDAAYTGDHKAVCDAGVAPCKHAAVVARRMEREGELALSEAGRWVRRRGPAMPAADQARIDRYRHGGRAS